MKTEDKKDPNIFQIVCSMLAAFVGVQNRKNHERDAAFIEKKGVKIYIIIGFCLVITFLFILFAIVRFVVP